MSSPISTPQLTPGDAKAAPTQAPQNSRRRSAVLLLAVGLLLIGLNLRIGVASVGPVLNDVRADLGMSATAASLLTTIPVVAFGAFAFLTPGLTRRLGMHRLLGVTMAALTLGILLRLQPSMAGLFGGTVIVGAAIAIGNVVMPMAIKHDFARHTGLMMGLYSTVLFVGASLASGATVPLVGATGSWRSALAVWAIPAVIAFVVWIPQLRRSPGHVAPHQVADAPSEYGEPTFRALLRDRTALAVTAHMGLQSLTYYAFITWVPTLLQDAGMDAHEAGWMVSFSAFPAIAATLITPAFSRRIRPGWVGVVISVLPLALGYLGLGVAPTAAPYLWMTLLGIGQGVAISLALSYIVWRSPDARHTGHVSTMAQGVGYLVAALGPFGIGALHSVSGGWTLPLITLGILLVLQLASGAIAAQDRHVLSARP